MKDVIKKIDSQVDKRLGRIIMWIIIGITIFAILMNYIFRVRVRSHGDTESIATITPSNWTLLPTKGKDMEFSIIPTNGMKLRYTVVLDGNMNNKFVFPGTNIPRHLYYGVTNLWVTLNNGQEHSIGYLSYSLSD